MGEICFLRIDKSTEQEIGEITSIFLQFEKPGKVFMDLMLF